MANFGFETEDPAATGFPDDWAVSLVGLFEEGAAFDYGQTTPPDSPLPFEGFGGGWSSNETYTFAYTDPIDLGELDPAIFDSALPDYESVEDFEEGWSSNQNYTFILASVAAAAFDTGTPEPVEDFEDEWTDPYLEDWADVVGGPGEDAADFDASPPEAVEDFEDEWTDPYLADWADVTGGPGAAGAVFDGEAFEDFEEVNGPHVVTVNPGTDVFTAVGHGMSNGQVVTFENSGGTLPAGIQPKTNYFVISAAANTFQVSATSGGSAVDVTGTGTGTHRVRPDTAVFWTTVMVTL